MTSLFTSASLAYIFHIYSDKFQKAYKTATDSGKLINESNKITHFMIGLSLEMVKLYFAYRTANNIDLIISKFI